MATSKKAPPKPLEPTATRLLLVRHGEVESSYHKKFGGRIDMNLSPNGRRQAKVLADYLRGKTIDAIYASPMKRVQQTLAPTLKHSPHQQTIFPGLREIDFGRWTSLGWQQVEEQFGFKSHEWLHQIHKHGIPEGESGKVFRQRVEPCLRQIMEQHPGENVAIFCHGGVIRMILAILLKLPLPKTNHFDIEYASITQVALHEHMNEIELLNFTPWRDLGCMSKPLWHLSVATSLEAEDAIMELLGGLTGCTAAAYFNLETRVSQVSVFGDKPFPKQIRTEILAGIVRIKKCGLSTGTSKVSIARIKREDWAESWKKHFKPIEIGRSLLVKPSWIKRQPRKGQAVIILDPGLSFGTGQHPTTSFCLGEIARLGSTAAKKSFLDIGTGSGILAIGAAKLGYRPVSAFDFDPESVRVAKANARVNGVERQLKITQGDVTKLPAKAGKQFDLVCANLISNLLIAEKTKIAAQVRPEGVLVLAGILAAEFSLVQRAFEALGMKLIASKVENEWRSGSFCFDR